MSITCKDQVFVDAWGAVGGCTAAKEKESHYLGPCGGSLKSSGSPVDRLKRVFQFGSWLLLPWALQPTS